jgi:hypothetical protein
MLVVVGVAVVEGHDQGVAPQPHPAGKPFPHPLQRPDVAAARQDRERALELERRQAEGREGRGGGRHAVVAEYQERRTAQERRARQARRLKRAAGVQEISGEALG